MAYEQRCKEHDQSNKEYENKATFTPKEEDRVNIYLEIFDSPAVARRVL